MSCRSCAQCGLWFGSILVFIAGVILSLSSILVYFAPDFKTAFDLIDPPKLYIVIWSVTGIGILSTFISFCGCYGAGHSNRCCLGGFFFIVLIGGSALIGVSVYLFTQVEKVDSEVKIRMDWLRLNVTDSYASYSI